MNLLLMNKIKAYFSGKIFEHLQKKLSTAEQPSKALADTLFFINGIKGIHVIPNYKIL